jgi:hypothetical protein
MNTRTLLLFFCLFFSTLSAQTPTRTLTLQPEPQVGRVRGFTIQTVLDDRPQRGTVGTLAEGTPLRPVPVQLTGGTAGAVQNWLRRSLPAAGTGAVPIVLRIREFRLTETVGTGGRITGRARLAVVFATGRDTLELTEYAIQSEYARSVGNAAIPEQTLRTLLSKAILYFNGWLPTHGEQAEPLARRVTLRFLPMPAPAHPDTVFYSPTRPLRWSDFRGGVRSGSRYGAAVYTSFGYEARTRTRGGEVHIDLLVRVYLVKEQSWAKPTAQNDYALRHEQLHFDITRIGAERFRQRLLAEDLPPDDYDSRIQYIFLEVYREVHAMQQRYDDETTHSLNREAQARWDAYVTKELAKIR